MVNVERVKLNNSSRSGYYFRVSDNLPILGRVHSYYKVAGKRGVKSAGDAVRRFRDSIDDRVEEVTLHYRVDYDSSGHGFYMRDSSASLTVRKGLTDEQAKEKLEIFFQEAFEQELGAPLWESANKEIVQGLERTPGYGTDEVKLRYNHGGGKDRMLKKSRGSVEKQQRQITDFFKRRRR